MVYDGVIYTTIKRDYSPIASSLSSHKVPPRFYFASSAHAAKKKPVIVKAMNTKGPHINKPGFASACVELWFPEPGLRTVFHQRLES